MLEMFTAARVNECVAGREPFVFRQGGNMDTPPD